MIKIEAVSLEQAYQDAAFKLECSVTELHVEIVQSEKKGIFGLFKKSAIIIASKKEIVVQEEITEVTEPQEKKPQEKNLEKNNKKERSNFLDDTYMPQSFVSMQDEEEHDFEGIASDFDEQEEIKTTIDIDKVVKEVDKDINELFKTICFDLKKVDVSAYDATTILIEFNGEDAALLIGKEGYRYKALSYMLFNWLHSKYNVGLRLEIAEFLKNQEQAVHQYLEGVYEGIERDGRAQTKVLDGVLVQIALNALRQKYPQKYVAIRTTRDGSKYIIVNNYHAN